MTCLLLFPFYPSICTLNACCISACITSRTVFIVISYIAGEFVGGSDIMIELYQNGELAQMIEVANAS
jgi:hypothetical protein